MESVSIYLFDNRLFFVPKLRIINGPIVISEPIEEATVNDGPEDVGEKLIRSLKQSHTTLERPSTNAFNVLLQRSKAHSNRRLVARGMLLNVDFDGNLLTLELMKADSSISAFVSDPHKEKLVLEVDLDNLEEIGQSIFRVLSKDLDS